MNKLNMNSNRDLGLNLDNYDVERLYSIQNSTNLLLKLLIEDISLQEILERALDILISESNTAIDSQGGIFLVEEANTLTLWAHKKMPAEIQQACAKVTFGNCICGKAAESKQLLFAKSHDKEHTVQYFGMPYHEHYCIPIVYKEEVIGLIVLYVEKGRDRDLQEEEFLKSAADILAGVIVQRQNEEKYEQLFEQAATGIFIADPEHNILDANLEACNILGYSKEELKRLNGKDLNHPDDIYQNRLSQDLEKMTTQEPYFVERNFLRKDGTYIPVEVTLKSLQGLFCSQTHMVMFHDILDRKQAEEKLNYLAYYDELTGLPNRKLFMDRLEHAVSMAKRSDNRLALLYINIDRLKSINDTIGRHAGDKIIQEVAYRIRKALRDEDMVARIHGDQFMVLASHLHNPEKVQNLGERIHKVISEVFELEETQIYPAVSIGYALYPDDGKDADTLMKQTDIAMYEAKNNYINKVQRFVGQEDWISKQFYMENELKKAMDNEEFVIFYQPQIDLLNNTIMGMEALLRWQHPQKGLVPPDDFIPLLEETGMIIPVGEWILHNVCRQLKFWHQNGWNVKGSVNISFQQLNHADLINPIEKALRENDLQPRYLEMELTETMVMQNIVNTSDILKKLSEWGIKVALDDFGKGYSSLNYLHQLPIDTIKIDKQFIYDLPENQNNEILVQTIINMAHNLGKRTLAEGVETKKHVDILRKLNCEYAQGFLFDRPKPVEKIDLGNQKIHLGN